MGILDQERLASLTRIMVELLPTRARTKGVDEPFCIEFSSRKQSKHKVRFYSFLGREALVAWKEYLERARQS